MTISLIDTVARNKALDLAEPTSLNIAKGEQIAIVGRNGAGKSLLCDLISSSTPIVSGKIEYDFSPSKHKYIYENIVKITFRDSYGVDDGDFYYQRRWNSTDIDELPTVRGALGDALLSPLSRELIDLFSMESMLDKRLIMLSSGELRKFMMVRALKSNPRVVIIDNPFIGLDAPSRDLLSDLLERIAANYPIQFILQLSLLEFIPSFITDVVVVEDRRITEKITREKYLATRSAISAKGLDSEQSESIMAMGSGAVASQSVAELRDVSIRYGDKTILDKVSWSISGGECWALSGANGSGKSTLLSLICADNPQSYACDISLFGKKRGSGESIWDIKRNIGYLSPEMCRGFVEEATVVEVVGGGLYDNFGQYRNPREGAERDAALFWMDIFGVGELADRSFFVLSSGQQRLVLLARAFVRDPEFLILDEPLHGLDNYNRAIVKSVIEAFCQRENKTMIIVTHYAEELPGCITDHKQLTAHRK